MQIDRTPSKFVIRSLLKQCFPSDTLDLLPDEHYLVLTDDRDKAIAFASFRALDEPNVGHGYVSAVGVVPKMRGHGLQRHLLDHVDHDARDLGVETLVTYVLPSNGPSLVNFIRCGYHVYVPEEWWAGQGVVYLAKDI